MKNQYALTRTTGRMDTAIEQAVRSYTIRRIHDSQSFQPKPPPAVKKELQHFGKCQKITVYFIRQSGPTPGSKQPLIRNPEGRPHILLTDLDHAPLIDYLDLERFDGKPGSIIRIASDLSEYFVNVTVKVSDMKCRVMDHERAHLDRDMRHWCYVYFPKHRLADAHGVLKLEIRASTEPRKPCVPWNDPYELAPDELRSALAIQN